MTGLRSWLNENSTIATVASVIIMIVALWVILQMQAGEDDGGGKAPTQRWFYDLKSGELFAGDLYAIAPIAAPSGPLPDGVPAGAGAYVLGCGGCEPAQREVAYLEVFTPEAKALLEAEQAKVRSQSGIGMPMDVLLQNIPGVGQGRLVKRPGDDRWAQWTSPDSDPVRNFIREFSKKCRDQGKNMRPCWPSE